MQGDLISRSALIEKLWEIHKDVQDKCYVYTNVEEVTDMICGIVALIDEQPTVYNVEKVVAELEEREKLHNELSKSNELTDEQKLNQSRLVGCIKKTLAIVRNGGKE